MFRAFKIREFERGFLFRDRDFERILGPGRHWIADPFLKARVDRVSVRDVLVQHPDLEVIARSGALTRETRILDLQDHERALVWVDGRFFTVLEPGLHALWTVFHQVRVETVDTRSVRFEHELQDSILSTLVETELLHTTEVAHGQVGLFYLDGELRELLRPGLHLFWKNVGRTRIFSLDLREQTMDISGQEIMTADKVTLRLNSSLVYRVQDPERAATQTADHAQSLYRDAQLALRGVVGTRDLDALLSDKDEVGRELETLLRTRAADFGIEVISLGIRDVILPGEMKSLLNQVTEAKKAAEAALITRREETAAIRSQANTAKLLDANPTLMRLRELEVLEKVAEEANLNVVLGEQGLAERVMKLL